MSDADNSDSIPTLADVAELAFVSKTTASVALSGRGRISDKTRQTVLAAAKQLGYRSSGRSRYFRHGQDANLVAVVFSSLPDGSQDHPAKQFWERAVDGFIYGLTESGIATVIIPAPDEVDLSHLPVEVVILVSNHVGTAQIPETVPAGMPMILAGRSDDENPFVAVFRPDFKKMIFGALAHLFERGSRHPALLMARLPMAPIGVYDKLYRSWCSEHSVDPLVKICDTDDDFEAVSAELVEAGADSIMVLPDDSLPHVEQLLRVIRDHQLTVPEDVMVISISDGRRELVLDPTVTTCSTRGHTSGVHAARLVAEGLQDKEFHSADMQWSLVPARSTDRALVE